MSYETFSPSIVTLGLSVRARNALERHKKDMTIGDLCAMTQRQVRALRGIDRKRFTEIRVALTGLDLDFAPEPPPPPPAPARADDGTIKLLEPQWDGALAYGRKAHDSAFALQSCSMDIMLGLSRLEDVGGVWRARALDAEESLRTKEARIQELQGELARAPNRERFERLMSLLAQVSIALEDWNVDPDSRRAEERLTDRLVEILDDTDKVFDLSGEIERVQKEGA